MKRIPDLFVEGRDDKWSILALLEVNGIKLVENQGPVNIRQTYSVSELLDGMDTFVKAAQAARAPVGFVLDIDLNIETRWQSICAKFKKLGISVTDAERNSNGVVLDLPAGKVGIWLMPDNQSHTGKLEDFLRTLIRDDDAVLPHAKAFVGDVGNLISAGERYRDIDIEKAEMSAWLSVQNPPGEPYGTAIKSHILQPTSPIAERFVNWFKKVYSL